MIIKYTYNGNLTCMHFENKDVFLKECYNPKFKDILFNATNVIVLENEGNSYSCDNLLEVYYRCKNYIVKEKLNE